MNIAPVHVDTLPRFASIEDLITREKPIAPFYALSPEKFRTAAKRFLDAFPGDTLYAIKANPAPHVLDQVYAAGIRHFDTASLAEIEIVKNRFPDAHCHFMAPVRAAGSAHSRLRRNTTSATTSSIAITNSTSCWPKPAAARQCASSCASPRRSAARVLELSSKFGTTPDDAARLLKRVVEAGATPALTFHVGSQCLSPFSYAQAIEMARRTAATAGVKIAALDIGGGFPGPYMGNDVPPYHWYFDTIKEALATLPEGEKLPVMCEPGRALVAEGLSLVTQVILRKGDKLYINDGIYGSFDELTLPGWVADYPIRVFTPDSKGRAQLQPDGHTPFRVYGPTCDTLDVLPRPLMLPETIGPGDFIVFDAIGAYSVAVRTNFNGFFPDHWAIVGN